MDDLNKIDLVELKPNELKKVEGGNPWTWIAIGYVVGQVLDGIQEGLMADCSEVECCES
jgi:hypothetical protein